VPPLPAGLSYVEVAAGGGHSVARRSDGSAVAWGSNAYGQSNVPSLPAGLTYAELAAGNWHTVARLSDGQVVAWGRNDYGQCNVPALPGGLSYVEVAAGDEHTVARLSDGQVVAWGRNDYSQCNVPALPAGHSYLEVAAGGFHTIARRSDGQVVAWGRNDFGQCNVPALPAGLSYVEIAGGGLHSVALRTDEQVVAWGRNNAGQCDVPTPAAGHSYVEVSAGRESTVARTDDGPGSWSYCDPGAAGVIPCPCFNSPNGPRRGCDNSDGTGGAWITASGQASLSTDSLTIMTGAEKSIATSIVLQGDSAIPSGIVFGQGVRCVGGLLKRLYVKVASGGSITAPQTGDDPVSARSAALGDPIQAGEIRNYAVYYRDPLVLGGCAPSSTFNSTQSWRIEWSL